MNNESELRVDYIKSNSFRVVHADGLYGGITPRGNIHVDFWSERPTIPQQVVYSIDDGTIGNEIGRHSRNAQMVREVEVGVVLDIGVARAIVQWLQSQIATLETSFPGNK